MEGLKRFTIIVMDRKGKHSRTVEADEFILTHPEERNGENGLCMEICCRENTLLATIGGLKKQIVVDRVEEMMKSLLDEGSPNIPEELIAALFGGKKNE